MKARRFLVHPLQFCISIATGDSLVRRIAPNVVRYEVESGVVS